MAIEEVYKCKDPEGNEEWRGMHSGKKYSDFAVTENGPFAFANYHAGDFNCWDEDKDERGY